jgi:ketosteroid isomerase-like protein
VTTGSGSTSGAWISRYYQLSDDLDWDGVMEYWAPDGVLRFANYEPATGRAEIRARFDELINSWAEAKHTLLNLWDLPGGVVAFELDVAFVRHDGVAVNLVGAAVCQVEGERFLVQRIYVDLSPVFAVTAPQAAADALETSA